MVIKMIAKRTIEKRTGVPQHEKVSLSLIELDEVIACAHILVSTYRLLRI